MLEHYQKRDEKGFTLIELLVAIVVVSILAAVAIVGINGLNNNGSKSACTTTSDAAKAAAAVYYANDHTPAYASSFTQLTDEKALELPTGVSPTDDTHLAGKGWTLAMSGNGSVSPSFTCNVP